MNCSEYIAANRSHPSNKAVIIHKYLLQFCVHANQSAVAGDCAVVLLLYLTCGNCSCLAFRWNFWVSVKLWILITSNQGPTEGENILSTRPPPLTVASALTLFFWQVSQRDQAVHSDRTQSTGCTSTCWPAARACRTEGSSSSLAAVLPAALWKGDDYDDDERAPHCPLLHQQSASLPASSSTQGCGGSAGMSWSQVQVHRRAKMAHAHTYGQFAHGSLWGLGGKGEPGENSADAGAT